MYRPPLGGPFRTENDFVDIKGACANHEETHINRQGEPSKHGKTPCPKKSDGSVQGSSPPHHTDQHPSPHRADRRIEQP